MSGLSRRSLLQGLASAAAVIGLVERDVIAEAVKLPDVIVDAKNGDKGRLFDRTGSEIRYVMSANLTTGECFQLGVPGTRDPNTGKFVLFMKRYPSPLRFDRAVTPESGSISAIRSTGAKACVGMPGVDAT